MRASLEGRPEGGIPMTVIGVYESRMFLVLKRVEEGQLAFNRIGVLHCERKDRIVLSEWGLREKLTIV